MSPQITEQVTATPPAPPRVDITAAVPKTSPPGLWERLSKQGPWFWALLGLGTVLNGLIVWLIVVLFTNQPKEIPPPEKIHVPFADNKELWREWAKMPAQEDGRVKPFESVCVDIVRSVTGRSKFQGNDPVAVVVSWMMLFQPAPAPSKLNYKEVEERTHRDPPVPWTSVFEDRAEALANQPDVNAIDKLARKLDCNWDAYPFILCDHQELRQKIYREKIYHERHPGSSALTLEQAEKKHGPVELTLEQAEGKYIDPDTLRGSNVLKALVKSARAKRRVDEKALLTMLENKALEVDNRLRLFDRTRSLGEFGLVALDSVGPVWFRLDHLRYFFVEPLPDEDGGKIDGRVIWDRWLKDTRIQHDRLYHDQPVQPFPAEQVRKAHDAFVAARAAYRGKDEEKFAARMFSFACPTLRAAYRGKDEEKFAAASTHFINTLDEVGRELTNYPASNTIPLELTFNKVVPFQKAWIYGVLAAVLLAVSVVVGQRWTGLSKVFYFGGLAGYAAALGYAIFGFYCRVSISGRPPVSDMYESIIWVSFMTAVFGLALELVYRRGYIALAGALVSTLGFVLADQMPLTFAPSIKPLNAVLRSNYWLIIHVLTIVSSYAAFALAWGLGNINIGLIMFSPERESQIKTLSHYSYKAIQVGVILLFLGTMLGGFWAAESWGRFWGWDPKEVWALIAFLCYIIPLHARYVGWVKDFGLAACSVICFSFVVMAWYGVNFILGAGLHSYGFGSGKNEWLYLAAMTNISLVVHAGLRYMARARKVPVV
jgi:ABC-type transport system involved in cytochrome c biogenesis permease subunit